MPISEFLDVILEGGSRGDEAMYLLLHRRLLNQLRSRYEVFQRRLQDGFDDVLADFFLYLRDGKTGCNTVTYMSLRSIKSKEAFETWILNTFRNYLSVRAAKEGQHPYESLCPENIPAIGEHDALLTDERKLAVASTLIAYAHQSFPPRDRFIFLRSLLTLLNRQQAMPNDEMAEALGMSAVAYRVSLHRVRRNLAKVRLRLLQGENFKLDADHRQMSQCINDDFTQLYHILFTYYCQTIDTLARADAVKQLRQEYLNATGLALHEPEARYSIAPSISAFWTMLSHLLNWGTTQRQG